MYKPRRISDCLWEQIPQCTAESDRLFREITGDPENKDLIARLNPVKETEIAYEDMK